MTNNIAPWRARTSDFSKPGWHTKPTVAYQLMFEFLRLSPSYELARKYNNEGLTALEEEQLPGDFDSVLTTYGLCGDVQHILFREWWLERGLQVFGNPYTKPKVHAVGVLAEGKNYEASEMVAAVEKYLHVKREQEGLESTLVLAVPIRLKRSEIRKQLDVILDSLEKRKPQQKFQPHFKLECKRLRAKTLFDGLRLLWFRAAKPKWEIWRLGAKARVSATYSPELKVNNPRRVVSTLESYDREMMTKITSRALKKYEAIAENAARGRFPTQTQVEAAAFNYPDIAKRIIAKNTWEKRRIAHYKKSMELSDIP